MGIVYGAVLKKEFVTGYVIMGVKFVVLHFLLSGIVIAFMCKFIAEKYLRKEEKKAVHQTLNSIEPMYAFDIHCNSFFPYAVMQYFL